MATATKADKSLERSRARAEFRKEIVAAGAESQVKIARERGRVRRATEKSRTNERIRERQASEAARISSRQQQATIAQQTMEARKTQRVQTQAELNALRNRQRVVVGTQRTVTNSSVWSTVVMIFFLMFGMIVIYVLVTNGQAFGNIAGTIGNFVHGLSSNSPLFVATPKDSGNAGQNAGSIVGGGVSVAGNALGS